MSEGNVLVIDDEETMCNLLRDILVQEGYQVTTAQKAKDGLKIIQNNSFDLTITDLKLPDMDGIEITKKVKDLDIDNMVVVITGYPSFETVREALRSGAYGYITKPFNLEEIFFTVKRAIEFRRLKLANKRLMRELEDKNVSLEKKVEERTRDLKQLYRSTQAAYMATVRALAQAIDAKDHYTHSHSESVTKYALIIAKKLNFSQEDIKTLREACQLHDLGKIGVHDYILNKTEKLTKKEWEEVRLHSLRGAEILEPLSFLDEVTTLIKQHHERYDGTGYPYGLKGTEIKLGARILSVADSFDAMVSERPYRKAFPLEEAIAKLKEGSGTQFDPHVIKVFLQILKENPKILVKPKRNHPRLN